MSLEELNNILNLFDINMVKKENDIYFFSLDGKEKFVTCYYECMGSSLEEVDTTNIYELLSKKFFGVNNSDRYYDMFITYDKDMDTYNINRIRMENLTDNISKIFEIKHEERYTRYEYFVDDNDGYSYTVTITQSKTHNWCEIYFDELDMKKSNKAITYRASGGDVLEASSDALDYNVLLKKDSVISRMIDILTPHINTSLKKLIKK